MFNADAAAAVLLAALLLAGCGRNQPAEQAAGGVEAATAKSNQQFAQTLNLADQQDFEDAARGLIARPSGKVLNAEDATILDYDRFAFIQGDAPASANPSLWRQAKLNNNIGLFKVMDGIYQLRGFDLANITLIEGKTGWIVVDTLTSRETAAAAMAFARKHLGDKKVSALTFTHSHVDHFGGALGVISGEEAAARNVPIVAPEGFLEEATSENVLLGPSMGRRAAWMYGTRLPASATGLIDEGLGKAVALQQNTRGRVHKHGGSRARRRRQGLQDQSEDQRQRGRSRALFSLFDQAKGMFPIIAP